MNTGLNVLFLHLNILLYILMSTHTF